MRQINNYSHDNTNYMLNQSNCESLLQDTNIVLRKVIIEPLKVVNFDRFQTEALFITSPFSQHNSYYHYGTSNLKVL